MVNSTFDYKEKFKQSLRTYERSGSRHGPARPVFSAVYGGRSESLKKSASRFMVKLNNKLEEGDSRNQGIHSKSAVKLEVSKQTKKLETTTLEPYAETRKDTSNSPEEEHEAEKEHPLLKKSFNNISLASLSAYPRDILGEVQHTYPLTYVRSQTHLNQYQRSQDQRLSAPKHSRKKEVAKKEQKSPYINLSSVFLNQNRGRKVPNKFVGAQQFKTIDN
jgi:hypothetical protein